MLLELKSLETLDDISSDLFERCFQQLLPADTWERICTALRLDEIGLSTHEVKRTFAYGSNPDEDQMKKRCPNSSIECVGRLPGYRLGFTPYSKKRGGGVADVIESAASEVWGLIYRLTAADVESLDKYEGYPTSYTRSKLAIETPEGIVNDVWVYTVVTKQEFIPPTREYLHTIKRAALNHGFPADYRESLERIPVKH